MPKHARPGRNGSAVQWKRQRAAVKMHAKSEKAAEMGDRTAANKDSRVRVGVCRFSKMQDADKDLAVLREDAARAHCVRVVSMRLDTTSRLTL